jgi:hypothetical protein
MRYAITLSKDTIHGEISAKMDDAKMILHRKAHATPPHNKAWWTVNVKHSR